MNHLALSFLLTTVNALQCYQTNFTKCESEGSRWKISVKLFSLGFGTAPKSYYKCNFAEPHQCDKGDIVCNTLMVTCNGSPLAPSHSKRRVLVQDTSTMEVKKCSKSEKCDVRVRGIEEEIGKTVNKLECGFCYGDLCNEKSTNLTMKELNTRCYVTSEECYDRKKFDTSGLTEEELLHFKNRTYYCFKREFKTQRCNDSQVCLSIALTLSDGDVLTLKKCNNEVKNDECSWKEIASELRNFTGREIVDGKCNYCDGNLCNYYTEMAPKPDVYNRNEIYCYSTDYGYYTCRTMHKNDFSRLYNCLKDIPLKFMDKCSVKQQCGTAYITFEEATLIFRNCISYTRYYCETGSQNIKRLERQLNKTVVNTTCEFCNETQCNHHNQTSQFYKKRGPRCYQSDLNKCLDNVTLIIDKNKMLACVKTINENNTKRECEKNEKCVTITLTTGNDDKLYYRTCGTGPKSSCEMALKAIRMEHYIDATVKNVTCEYCESDGCNDVDPSSARQAPSSISEQKIQCYNSIPKFCEDKFYRIPEDQLENKDAPIYREIYDCLRNMKTNITWCKMCLTLTFVFEDDSFQSSFCDDFLERIDFCRPSSRTPMNKEYFWRFTRQVLKYTNCDMCETDLCNEITIRGKHRSEGTRSRANQQFSESIIVILNIFTVMFKIVSCMQVLRYLC